MVRTEPAAAIFPALPADEYTGNDESQSLKNEVYSGGMISRQDIEPADSSFNKIIYDAGMIDAADQKTVHDPEPADQNTVQAIAPPDENTQIAEQVIAKQPLGTILMIAWFIVIFVVTGSVIYLFYPQLTQLLNTKKRVQVQKQAATATPEIKDTVIKSIPVADTIKQG